MCLPVVASCATAFVVHSPPTSGSLGASASTTRGHQVAGVTSRACDRRCVQKRERHYRLPVFTSERTLTRGCRGVRPSRHAPNGCILLDKKAIGAGARSVVKTMVGVRHERRVFTLLHLTLAGPHVFRGCTSKLRDDNPGPPRSKQEKVRCVAKLQIRSMPSRVCFRHVIQLKTSSMFVPPK